MSDDDVLGTEEEVSTLDLEDALPDVDDDSIIDPDLDDEDEEEDEEDEEEVM